MRFDFRSLAADCELLELKSEYLVSLLLLEKADWPVEATILKSAKANVFFLFFHLSPLPASLRKQTLVQLK